ncbi:hypothetical protein SDC9_139425 [bioreactor metagenome]|uniref:Uncharacterized protein n=1 Tax=bioreactor metagenome TaxID=1076179 RepID=A0A645DS34_9ZZZZ
MNKTLRTVLITLAVTVVFLFAVVMLFGEDQTVPASTSSHGSENILADAQMKEGADTQIEVKEKPESAAGTLSQEQYAAALAYDVFDWNSADEKTKADMAESIISVWADYGDSYEQSAKELVTYIGQHLYDQANIFEVACTAAQIDPQPYFERMN